MSAESPQTVAWRTRRPSRAAASTARADRLAAMFGLAPADDRAAHEQRLADAERTARRIDRSLRPGRIALIAGPSGAGKTTILRALDARLASRGRTAVRLGLSRPRRPDRSRRPIIDRLRLPLPRALCLLSRAGLADAALLLRDAAALSAGQRFRLDLALALAAAERAGPGAALLIDELASNLDRATAACIARTLRRWATASRVRLVAATAHDDLLEPLAPDLLVIARPAGPARIHDRRRPA